MILNGFLADQDNHVVVLRGIDGQNIVLPPVRLRSCARATVR